MENNIVQYKGFLDYSLLNKLLMDFITYVKDKNIENYYLKKLQIVMVEMLENNYQYTHRIEEKLIDENLEPEFKILRTEEGFKVIASNPILIEDADLLKFHLENINSLGADQLKVLYKETLKGGMHIKKNNAGTGLIRIIKVSKNKIKYSFRKINNKLLYYTLETLVNPK
ncbi:MAG: hypothetical protein C0597_12065 [Marinilabiliales bacterium]|nr:MAG: hypothetical protein C0597_12065 [Marinilabiliales bacterium]